MTKTTQKSHPAGPGNQRRVRVIAALTIAVALLLAACGSSSNESTASTAPTAVTVAQTSADPTPAPATPVVEAPTATPVVEAPTATPVVEAPADPTPEPEVVADDTSIQDRKVSYHTVDVDDVEMFYRAAGPADAPVLVLLHGFPTSSHMFRDLIPLLANEYRVIAPDLPGFGSTVAPPPGEYDYTFDNLAVTVDGFLDTLELDEYALYLFDYGAPVGFRVAAENPDEITALISQNGNAYEEGLEPAVWDQIGAYWAVPSLENRDALRGFLTIETTRFQYSQGVPEELLQFVSPDPIAHDQAILDRDPELQLDFFLDYETNVEQYPEWHEYFRTSQPPFLAVWGNADPFFSPAGAEAFLRDLPEAEIEFFDSGHFALETHAEEIAESIDDFLDRTLDS